MKKIISVILALIAIGQLTVTSAFFDSNEISLEEYSSQLSDLNKTYGIDSIGSINNNSNQIQKFLNRIIVKTNDNNPLEEDCGAIAKVEGYDCLHIMQYTSQKIAEQAFEYYSNLSSVEYVEFDFFFQISEPEFDQKIDYGDYGNDNDYLSWGSSTVNSNKAVAYANSLAEAPEIIVAVIETGIDEKHSFFEDRIIDSEVDLIENDGNPYDDHVKEHGTHVAGIIVDNTAKNVKVSAYKTHDSQGWGNYSLTCMAIDLAVEDKVNVINMSCGWENTENCYNLFEDKIENAVGNNICVVVSAGNNGIDASQQCPASNSNVITVSSITNKNKPSEFSNFGVCVDIAAPGSNINSTLPNNSFGERNGTSMAAPFVAAAAAFMKTIKDYYPSNIERIIKETAFVPDGWDSRYGIGIISFANIMSRLSSSPPMLSFN